VRFPVFPSARMYLKSLALQGFKSFADATIIEFNPGVTGIVGPNGCGKSNIVDAIRWVLGETSAKALRGGEMADVIFNGTDKRKPVGMAEVTLTLADCETALGVEFNEMSITRRVYRDGNSEYNLNGKKCRLKDILDVLMDTGIGRTAYSIMEQGKIDMLLSSKPEDRRAVFEEAAGITKFKSQKKEALRKLEYTEANLLRIEDIIAEVKRQMGTLQRQAQKARRQQALLGSVKTLDAHFSHRKFEELQAEHGELQTSLGSLQAEQSELEENIRTGDESLQSQRESLQQLEHDLNRQRESVTRRESEIQAAESRISFNGEMTSELEGLITQTTEDVHSLQSRLSQSQSELSNAETSLAAVVSSLTQQRQQFDEHSSQAQALRTQRVELEGRSAQLRSRLKEIEDEFIANRAKLESRETQLSGDRDRLSAQIQESDSLRVQQAEKQEAAEHIGSMVAELSQTLESRREQLSSSEVGNQEAEAALEVLRQQFDEIRGEHTAKTSRRDVLRQLIAEGEGLQEGTQEVLRGLDQPDFYKNGIRGVLGSFIEVEPSCVKAVEAALGNLLQTVIVADTEMAQSIINTLCDKEMGNVSLLSEDFVVLRDEGQMMTVPDGGIGWALDKTRVHDSVRGLMESLLGEVLIVEDLKVAMRLKPQMGRTAFATPRGDFISSDGVISGGAGKEDGSILERDNELRRLMGETEKTAIKFEEKSAAMKAKEEEVVEGRQQLELLRRTTQECQVELSNVQGSQATTNSELQQVTSKIEALEWEQSEIEKRLDGGADGISTLRARQEELQTQIADVRSEEEAASREVEEITRREAESAERVARLETGLAVEERSRENLEEQKMPIAERLAEFAALIARRSDDVGTHRSKIEVAARESEELAEKIEQGREETERLKQSLVTIRERREAESTQLTEQEKSLATQRARLSQIGGLAGREDVSAAKIGMRIENLEQSMRERYQIDLAAFVPDPHALLLCIDEQKAAHDKRNKRRATMSRKAEEEVAEVVAEESAAVEEAEPETFETEEDADRAVAEAVANEGRSADENGFVADPTRQAEDENSEADKVKAEEDELAAEIAELELAGMPDWDFVETAVGAMRQQLDAMGTVNPDAIAEFEELEERHDFLVEQHADLVNAKDELLRVISKINSTTKLMFTETFEAVRNNFQGAFKELFGQGARANLVLIDESNPLDSGIEVIAKPPGKKLQSISLLSGGERSMTAVALLFSIYMVKPSPFCVLDELDAPLDESNITRFLKMLDRFIDQSQFVIVTHNKRTMKRADVIYGITMEEFGVSKPVGMRLNGGESDKDIEIPDDVDPDSDSNAEPATVAGSDSPETGGEEGAA